MDRVENFIRRVPKADIHVHFEGLVTRCLFERLLGASNPARPTNSNAIFCETYRNLNDFIGACRAAITVIRSEDACFQVVTEYLRASHADGVVHVEIAIEPEVHALRGLPFEALVSAVRRALKFGRDEFGISSHLILSLVRDLPVEVAMRNFDTMLRDRSDFVAVGLASLEVGNPPSKFCEVFDRAKEEGFHLVVHAGEEGPPSYIWSAVADMGVDRIDHGLRATEDSELLEFLEVRQIPLALAPISYSKTNNLNGSNRERLGSLLRSNLMVSINSDDPGLFEAGLVANYLFSAKEFALSLADVFRLATNSIESSFMVREQKHTLVEQIRKMRAETA